jgi:hypothetical protein
MDRDGMMLLEMHFLGVLIGYGNDTHCRLPFFERPSLGE